MKVKKSFFNIIIWGLYSVILFTSICVGAIGVSQAENLSSFLLPLAISFGICVVAFAVLIYGYKFLSKFLAEKNKKGEPFSINSTMEVFILCMLIVISIAIRFVKVISFGDVFETPSLIYEYVNAISTATMPTASNGAFVYAEFLRFVMNFLGFKVSIALFCQVFLQILAIFLCFFTLKNYFGHLSAWISALLMALLPGSISAVEIIEPDFLIVDLIFVFLLCLYKLVRACERNKIRENWHIAFYIGLGVLGAVIAYLDIIGFVLLIIAVWVLFSNELEDKWINVQKPWYQSLFFVGSFIAVWAFMVMKLSLNSLEGTEALTGYFGAFIPQNGLNLSILSPNYGSRDYVVMLALGGLWLFEFLRSENDKAFPFTLLIVASTLFTFLTFDCSSYAFLNSALWMCLAGIGVTSLKEFDLKAGEEEQNEQRKNKREMKRRAKETKNALERGEKAISLATVSSENVSQSSPVINANGRKSYGIGRKAEDIVKTDVKEETLENVINTESSLKPIASVEDSINKPDVSKSENVNSESTYNVNTNSEEEVKLIDPTSFDSEDEDDENITFAPRADIPVREYKEPIAIGYGSYRRQEAQRQESDTVDKVSDVLNEETVNDLSVSSDESTVSSEDNRSEGTANSANTVRYAKLGNKRGKMFTPVRKATDPVGVKEDFNGFNNNANVKAVTHRASMDVRPVSVPSVVNAIHEEVAPVSVAPVVQNTVVNVENPIVNTPQPVTLGVGFQSSYSQRMNNSSATGTDSKPQTNDNIYSQNVSEVLPTDTTIKKITRPIEVKEDVDVSKDSLKKEKVSSGKMESSYAKKTWSIGSDTNMIKNPLPTPKPHVTKELDYDYIPTPAEMKFDIEDLQGREYFDI